MRSNKSAQFLERNPSRPNEENSITFYASFKTMHEKGTHF